MGDGTGGDPAPASSATAKRERLALIRDGSTLVRDILIALLVLVCVARPEILRSWLTALGVSKATLFGVELTPGKEKQLAEEIDGLKQQRDAAVFERNSMAKKAEDALRDLQRLRGADPAVSQAISSIQQASAQAGSTSGSGRSSWVENARQSIDSGGRWAVVYGGDTKLEDARGEIVWGARNKLPGTAIVLRQRIFRSVALAESPEAAEDLLAVARRRRSDAYVVNMQTWCPRSEQREGYRECM